MKKGEWGKCRESGISTISAETPPETFRIILSYLVSGGLTITTTFTAIATVREADLQRRLEVRWGTSSHRFNKNVYCKSVFLELNLRALVFIVD
jgi:hypothetical protein